MVALLTPLRAEIKVDRRPAQVVLPHEFHGGFQDGVAVFVAARPARWSICGHCSSFLPVIGTKLITKRLAVSLLFRVATGRAGRATSDVNFSDPNQTFLSFVSAIPSALVRDTKKTVR